MIQPQCFNNCTVCKYPGRPKFSGGGGRWVWMKKVPAMWIAGRRRFSDLRSTLFGGLVVVMCAPLAAAGSDLATPFLITVPRSPAEAARVAAITLPTTNFTSPEPFEANPAGAATAPAQKGAQQRSQPLANLSPEQGIDFIAGQGLFRKIWVASPASTLASDGLGPLFNARSCEACHAGGGRGHPAAEGGKRSPGLVLHLAVPVAGAAGATEISSYLAEPSAPLAPTRPHPVYGAQLQDFSTQGQQAEYQLSITYHDIAVDLLGEDFNYLGSDGNFYAGDTGWHSDGWTPKLRHIKFAFYLDPLTKDTGCLRVIPGSHRIGEPFAEALQAQIYKLHDHWGLENGREVPCVPLETQPGDLVLFNWNTKHAAFGGGKRRRMFTINASQRYPEANLQDLKNLIAGGARFWVEEPYGPALMKSVTPERMKHLEQVIANSAHLPELVKEAKKKMAEPSRG